MKNKITPYSNSNKKNLSQDDEFESHIVDYDYREKFDSIKTPLNLTNRLQDSVDKIIKECIDVDWNEDYLTYEVIKAIRYILSEYSIPSIKSDANKAKFDLEAYKLTGNAEQTHGDIAVVITRLFPNSTHSISGVGFYEAKASLRYGEFPAFSVQQLRRLVTHTPKLSYLLYDKEARFSSSQEWSLSEIDKSKLEQERDLVHSYTVDANFLKQCKNIGVAADMIGQSFGYHFVHKILSGRELDYSRSPIETIKRWLKVTRKTNPYIVSIAIQEEPTAERDIKLKPLQLPEFTKLELQAPRKKINLRLNSK